MVLLRQLLGDVLRRLRLRQGRTLREVSASARVSLGYLSEVERGSNNFQARRQRHRGRLHPAATRGDAGAGERRRRVALRPDRWNGQKVADAEARVEAFRAKSNLLVGPNGTTLSAQQLGQLNGRLAAARTLKADAQAKAKLVRQMLKSGEPMSCPIFSIPSLSGGCPSDGSPSPAQLAEQSSSATGNHPRIKELKAQIEDLDR